jgi:hypothetical protein
LPNKKQSVLRKSEGCMSVTDYTMKKIIFSGWIESNVKTVATKKTSRNRDILEPIRQWLGKVKITEPQIAHYICKYIPAQCPFAREVKLLGKTIVKIPPLCKLNPFYDDLMVLRYRAMCYLVDDCQEDVSQYC